MGKSAGPFWLGVVLIVSGVAMALFLSFFLLSTHDTNTGILYTLFSGLLFGMLPVGFGVALIRERATDAVFAVLIFAVVYSGVGFYQYRVGEGSTTLSIGLTLIAIAIVPYLYLRRD